MTSAIRALRAAALAAAVLILPCCGDPIGEGDQPSRILVRASLNLAKTEPDSGCFEASLSPNGRWLVFTSTSNVITPNDTNTIRDIFLKDRLTGEIVNLTNIFINPLAPQAAPGDCFEPGVSDDGNFIVFSSKGGWVPYSNPPGGNANPFIYRLDRTTGQFQKAYVDGGPFPDRAMSEPSISADGQVVAFATTATNLVPPNPDSPAPGTAGYQQIYVHNFRTGTSTIVSRAQSPAPLNTTCNEECSAPRISADGKYVVFQSRATDLDAAAGALPVPQVYRGTATGDYVVPVARDAGGALSTNVSFAANISADGRFVAFHTYDTTLVNPPASGLVLRDLVGGTNVLVTDQPGPVPFPLFALGYIPSVSADGRMVAFLSRSDALAGMPINFVAQVFVRDLQTGETILCSRHRNGTPSNIDCDPPRISSDGLWVAWATKGTTLIDGDTNGVSDVFLSGPLR